MILGKRLLELCACFDLCLYNGLIGENLDGNLTNVCDHGNSVVDYFAGSHSLLPAFQWLVAEGRVESDHMPVKPT